MKIRLILALLFAFSLGASAYYTEKAPVNRLESSTCCSGDPHIVIMPPVPMPTPPPAN